MIFDSNTGHPETHDPVIIGGGPAGLAGGLYIAGDKRGFVKADRRQKTNLSGVFAAGDVTSAPRQIATAVGEGVTAVLGAENYLENDEF